MGKSRAKSAVAFLLLFTSACSDIEFTEPKPAVSAETKQEKPPVPLALAPQLDVSTEALPSPNSYRLLVTVTNSQGKGWILRKQKVGGTAPTLIELPENGELSDQEVEAGATYKIELGRMNDSSFESHGSAQVEIPNDMIRTGVGNLSADIKNASGRLFLLAGSVTSIGQHNVSIEVKEIISENATIRNFPADAEASLGSPGASGGTITIKSSKLTGNLQIKLSGERGGKGFQGPKGDQGPQGPRGPTMTAQQLAGWSHSEIAFWLARNPNYLSLHPSKGGRGGNGAVGKPGYPGLTGGSAGSLIVDLPRVERSQFQIEQTPGAGGQGGDGGDGGDPGPGGLGGEILENDRCHNQWGSCCPPPPQGPPGDGGPRGPSGPQGISGALGKILINGNEIAL